MITVTQPHVSAQSARKLLKNLLEAQTEKQVHTCLEQAGLLDDSHWHPYGGLENNGGQFLNQQASPQGALVEKVVNSIDAVLTAKAYENDDLPNSPPSTMFEAAERYFNIPGGRLAEVTPTERGQIARSAVQVVFSGQKSPERPTITITDQGEGQVPEEFPQTFLSLSENNKLKIPFVQGKFNMGSTGAVPFCGKSHNYQLILSRRHPAAPGNSDLWGFTVVRRRHPDADERLSQFQYLAPKEKIMSICDDALPIWWNSNRSRENIQCGSLVRLYEYDLEQKTNAILDFSRMLNRRLYRIPFPIQVVELREFKGHTLENVIPGLETRLVEDSADAVEDGFPITDELRIPRIGRVRVSLVPFKEGTQTSRWMSAREAIIFTINGQAHAFEQREFLRRSGGDGVGFKYLAPSLLVEVDCSNLSPMVVEQLFMGSRDRMRDNDEKRGLLKALTKYLHQHQGLRDLNNRRRVSTIKQSTKSDVYSQELFQKMLDSSPLIAAIFRGSGKISAPVKVAEEGSVPFIGRPFPTYLEWLKGGPFLEKHCPINTYCEIELETDAENAFLSRPVDPGECTIEPNNWVRSRKLWNGKLSIRLQPPEGTPVGCKVPLCVSFRSSATLDVFRAKGHLVVDPAQPKKKSPTGSRRTRKPASVASPVIREVQKNSWKDHEFNERSVACVDVNAEETIVFVNMDNRVLENCAYREPTRTLELREMYKVVSAALAISLERAIEKGEVEREVTGKAFEAVGDVLVPAVDFAARVLQVEQPHS